MDAFRNHLAIQIASLAFVLLIVSVVQLSLRLLKEHSVSCLDHCL